MARIAIPLAEGFEDSELTIPYERLRDAGHEMVIFGPEKGRTVQGKRHQSSATIEALARELRPEDFGALVIPGGHAPDHLRLDADTVRFVRAFLATGSPVAAVCHGPQLLIEADGVRGRRLTSWPSIRTDLENAGAEWVDREVVVDGNLVTSRKPEDLEAFCAALLDQLRAAA